MELIPANASPSRERSMVACKLRDEKDFHMLSMRGFGAGQTCIRMSWNTSSTANLRSTWNVTQFAWILTTTSVLCRLESVRKVNDLWTSHSITFLDLSGLTLQTGPRNIVKDEYTPGGSIVGQSNLEMEGNEIGTIQHHPIHIPGMSYTAMAMHQNAGSG